MKPPEPKPLSPLLLRAIKKCPKCGRVLEGRADNLSVEIYHQCFRCAHPQKKTRRQPLESKD